MKYDEFLKTKEIKDKNSGFEINIKSLNENLFDWQKAIVKWAIARGRAALFEGCGTGKTIQQLEWASQVFKKEKEPILIVAPLAVAPQTKQEAARFDICDVNICNTQNDIINGINITNYEKLHKFNTNKFIGVVLDESSILKNFSGTIRNEIIDIFRETPYKLACSATPSPNDYMELGNHSEFLNVMTRTEMLSMFFINDTAHTGTWRLKGHVKNNVFWQWLSSWAIMLSNPIDIGFENKNFVLPEIEYHEHIIKTDQNKTKRTSFLVKKASTLNERRKVRKDTIERRCEFAKKLVDKKPDEKWLLWCNLNSEGSTLNNIIDNSVEVAGRHNNETKEKRMIDFSNGKIERLITKPKIAGLGMNWQICYNLIFVGLSDSWEQFYQAVRRSWRFGQNYKVNVHIIIEEREGNVLKNIKRKDDQAKIMIENMIKYTSDFSKRNIEQSKRDTTEYEPKIKMELPKWMQ